jgi:hypothetical protein
MQTLAIAYYVEGSRVVNGQGCLNYEMLLTHRMKPAPRGLSNSGHLKFC